MRQAQSLPSSALVVALADILIVIIAGYASTLLRFGPDFYFSNSYLILILLSCFIFFTTAIFSGVYQTWRGLTLAVVLSRYSYAFAVTVAIILGALVFSKSAETISRLWLASSMLTIYLAGVSFRIIYGGGLGA
jgi:hypothetical protein